MDPVAILRPSSQIPIPTPRAHVRHVAFKLWTGQQEFLKLKCNPPNKLPFLDFSLKKLFACLDVGIIVRLLGCVLTEQRIVLVRD